MCAHETGCCFRGQACPIHDAEHPADAADREAARLQARLRERVDASLAEVRVCEPVRVDGKGASAIHLATVHDLHVGDLLNRSAGEILCRHAVWRQRHTGMRTLPEPGRQPDCARCLAVAGLHSIAIWPCDERQRRRAVRDLALAAAGAARSVPQSGDPSDLPTPGFPGIPASGRS